MATERQVQESVARCVATMVFYHNTPKTRHTTTLMRAEVRTIAASMAELGLDTLRVKSQVVAPVEGELRARYGADGDGLYAEFSLAFEDATAPVPLLLKATA